MCTTSPVRGSPNSTPAADPNAGQARPRPRRRSATSTATACRRRGASPTRADAWPRSRCVTASPTSSTTGTWPPEFEGALVGLFGTPALGYLDRDTQLDVVTSAGDRPSTRGPVPTGQQIPPVRNGRDTIWSSPAIGDVDGDGANEIVVGGDCEGSGSPQPCYGIGRGGYVWAFNLDGSIKWSYFVRDAVVWSTPALIDLNSDGALDVVVGTGLYFLGPAANKIMALDGRTGQLLWDAATAGPVARLARGRAWSTASPGLGRERWRDADVVERAGQLLWQTCVIDSPARRAGTFGGVAIADINNDGTLDAVVQAEQHLRVLNAVTGAIETTRAIAGTRTGCLPSYATPTVAECQRADLDRAGQHRRHQRQLADRRAATISSCRSGRPAPRSAPRPWPTFKGNMARTGGPARSAAATRSRRPGGCASRCRGSPRRRGRREPHTGRRRQPRLRPARVIRRQRRHRLQRQLRARHRRPQRRRRADRHRRPGLLRQLPLAYVHLVADHLGTIRANAYVPAVPSGAPDRKVDTRIGLGGGRIPPSGRVCFAVAGLARRRRRRQPHTGRRRRTRLRPARLIRRRHAPVASNVNFGPGTVDPNVAVAPIGSDGQVCYVNSQLASVHLVADHLGTIRANAYVPAVAERRPRPQGRHPHRPRRRTHPTIRPTVLRRVGSPGDAAVVNLTPVDADGPGYGLLVSSDVPRTVRSNVNYDPGTVDPNVAVAPIGSDGQVCFVNSPLASVHLVADHLGTIRANAYVPAVPSGAPDRKVDTRIVLDTPSRLAGALLT